MAVVATEVIVEEIAEIGIQEIMPEFVPNSWLPSAIVPNRPGDIGEVIWGVGGPGQGSAPSMSGIQRPFIIRPNPAEQKQPEPVGDLQPPEVQPEPRAQPAGDGQGAELSDISEESVDMSIDLDDLMEEHGIEEAQNVDEDGDSDPDPFAQFQEGENLNDPPMNAPGEIDPLAPELQNDEPGFDPYAGFGGGGDASSDDEPEIRPVERPAPVVQPASKDDSDEDSEPEPSKPEPKPEPKPDKPEPKPKPDKKPKSKKSKLDPHNIHKQTLSVHKPGLAQFQTRRLN